MKKWAYAHVILEKVVIKNAIRTMKKWADACY